MDLKTIISLLGALGLGSLIKTLLDVYLLQGKLAKNSHEEWLRDKKLLAYSELSELILSFGLSDKKGSSNPFELFAVASKAILLISDTVLVGKINTFIVNMDKLRSGPAPASSPSKDLYRKMGTERFDLIKDLQMDLLRTKK